MPCARRGHAADIVSGHHLVIHGGYNGDRLLSDCYALDVETLTWSSLDYSAPKAGDLVVGDDGSEGPPPAPRSLHSLTSVGHSCVLLGGSGALGPLGDIAMLECPAVTAGLAQQHRLLETRKVQTGLGEEAIMAQGHAMHSIQR